MDIVSSTKKFPGVVKPAGGASEEGRYTVLSTVTSELSEYEVVPKRGYVRFAGLIRATRGRRRNEQQVEASSYGFLTGQKAAEFVSG